MQNVSCSTAMGSGIVWHFVCHCFPTFLKSAIRLHGAIDYLRPTAISSQLGICPSKASLPLHRPPPRSLRAQRFHTLGARGDVASYAPRGTPILCDPKRKQNLGTWHPLDRDSWSFSGFFLCRVYLSHLMFVSKMPLPEVSRL